MLCLAEDVCMILHTYGRCLFSILFEADVKKVYALLG